jgi:hypothetical protein
MQPDTRTLLRSGIGIFTTGILAALLTTTLFGGVSHQGPHTDAGWLALMVAMGCLPTGLLTLILAIAKVIGERRR